MPLRELLTKLENFWEDRIFFGARWLLAPAYFALVLALAVLSYKCLEEFVELVTHLRIYDEASAVAQVLVIVDLVLVMNLVLMIIFVGYVNFVSVIHPTKKEDWPDWMGRVDYSGLKVYVMGSIVAISAIKLLRAFLDLGTSGKIEPERLFWLTAIHVTFVVSVLILAVSNKFHVMPDTAQIKRFSRDEPEAH